MVELDPETRLNLAFKALAAPARRRIVGLLREAGTLRVTDLSAAFEMSLNGVSKHLKVLERAGLITRRIDGKTHWIGLDQQGLDAPYDWLHAERRYWLARLDALERHVTTKDDS